MNIVEEEEKEYTPNVITITIRMDKNGEWSTVVEKTVEHCEGCKWWIMDTSDLGGCKKALDDIYSPVYTMPSGYDTRVMFPKNFGCIHWREKK